MQNSYVLIIGSEDHRKSGRSATPGARNGAREYVRQCLARGIAPERIQVLTTPGLSADELGPGAAGVTASEASQEALVAGLGWLTRAVDEGGPQTAGLLAIAGQGDRMRELALGPAKAASAAAFGVQDAGVRSMLSGPPISQANDLLAYGHDFQLDPGHYNVALFRMYQIGYQPPSGTSMLLAKIIVTGDTACSIKDQNDQNVSLAARTEYWYVNHDALTSLVAHGGNGKLTLGITQEADGSVQSIDIGTGTALVVKHTAPRDISWQQSSQGTWSTYSFSLSNDTPEAVRTKAGCPHALSFTVATQPGSANPTLYSLSSTDWYQSASGQLFRGAWLESEIVTLEKSTTKPTDSTWFASCRLQLV